MAMNEDVSMVKIYKSWLLALLVAGSGIALVTPTQAHAWNWKTLRWKMLNLSSQKDTMKTNALLVTGGVAALVGWWGIKQIAKTIKALGRAFVREAVLPVSLIAAGVALYPESTPKTRACAIGCLLALLYLRNNNAKPLGARSDDESQSLSEAERAEMAEMMDRLVQLQADTKRWKAESKARLAAQEAAEFDAIA